MIIKFNADLKVIKKALALCDVDIPSDEELESKLTSFVVDISGSSDSDMKQAEMGFILIAVGQAFQ